MPPHGRWRRTKIVTPPPSRAQEISGGIKNALSRGETLAKAKQTFINAGYTPQEVQAATQMIRSKPSQIAKPLTPPQSVPAKQTSSKKIITVVAIVGVVILIIAVVLGLFWDKIF